MEETRHVRVRRWATRGALACVLAAITLTGAACAGGSETPANREGGASDALSVPFAGTLVYLDGANARSIDGTTGVVQDLFTLQGELGWSGFAELTKDGVVLYESLVDESPAIHVGTPGAGSTELLADVEYVAGWNGSTLLLAGPTATYAIDSSVTNGTLRDLGVGISSSALASSDGSELAYSNAISAGAPQGAELEQRLMVRALDASGPGLEIARGWASFQPLALTADALLYATGQYGQGQVFDLVLYDRRSKETTTLARDAVVLDSDPVAHTVAVETPVIGSAEETLITIFDVTDPTQVLTTRFESASAGTISAVRLLPDGAGLLVAHFYDDGAATIIALDTADGSQRTVAEFSGTIVSQLLASPDAQVAFAVLDAGGPNPADISRSIVVCDLTGDSTATLAEGSAGGLLQLVGVTAD